MQEVEKEIMEVGGGGWRLVEDALEKPWARWKDDETAALGR
jgi:hypothetical protein